MKSEVIDREYRTSYALKQTINGMRRISRMGKKKKIFCEAKMVRYKFPVYAGWGVEQ